MADTAPKTAQDSDHTCETGVRMETDGERRLDHNGMEMDGDENSKVR